MTIACIKCGGDNRRKGQRWCHACHAANMREWRKTHPLQGDAADRDRARHYANTYRKRGRLTPQPCEECGAKAVQMHHDDYSQPLKVRWRCRKHHLNLHGMEPRVSHV